MCRENRGSPKNRGTPELAGIVAAVWATGSLLGGLVLGASAKPSRLWLRAILAATGLLALVPMLPPVADPAAPWLVAVTLFLGGTTIASTLAAATGWLADIAPPERRAGAFGWFATATTGGGVLASPLTGWLLDVAGPAAAAGAAGGWLQWGHLR